MDIKITIAIPAFKAKYLWEAIQSVLSQSFDCFEIVIVNDASPEDVDSIVGVFDDNRIRYYKNSTNIGAVDVVDNWNKCLSFATGDYILCMGDDDVLLPNCLNDYYELIKKYPGLGIYHTWSQIIDENSNFINITASRIEFESVYSLLWHRWENRSQQFIGDFLFDVELLRKNGGFYKLPLAWASDDISAVIAASYKGIANTQRIGFCYRKNSSTISKTGNVDIKMKSIQEEEKWYEEFLSIEPIDQTDKMFWQCIKKMKPLFFEKKRGLTIANDLKAHSIFRVLYWLKRINAYKLSGRILIYSIIQSRK